MPKNKNLMLLLKDRQYKITSYTVWLPNWVECYDVRGITDPGNHSALVSRTVKLVASIHASRFPVGPIQIVLEHCQSMRLFNKLKNKMQFLINIKLIAIWDQQVYFDQKLTRAD